MEVHLCPNIGYSVAYGFCVWHHLGDSHCNPAIPTVTQPQSHRKPLKSYNRIARMINDIAFATSTNGVFDIWIRRTAKEEREVVPPVVRLLLESQSMVFRSFVVAELPVDEEPRRVLVELRNSEASTAKVGVINDGWLLKGDCSS